MNTDEKLPIPILPHGTNTQGVECDGQIIMTRLSIIPRTRSLHVSGHCDKCKEPLQCQWPLDQLIDCCPEPEDHTAFDERMLASMGISFPPDEQENG